LRRLGKFLFLVALVFAHYFRFSAVPLEYFSTEFAPYVENIVLDTVVTKRSENTVSGSWHIKFFCT
jgi:hypothetical protein